MQSNSVLRKSWRNAVGGSLLSAALALAALATTPALALDRATTVVISNVGQMNTLDPLRADYSQTNLIDNTLYDTLIQYDYDQKLVPGLATEFSMASDARSVQITLRPDVKFHDGTPMTAKDVAYTLDRLKRLGAGVASLIEGYDTTEIADDTHLTIKLSTPNSLFLGSLSKIYIINSALVSANAGADDGQGWLQGHDAGTGPYQIAEISGDNVTVSQFDGYWNKVEGRPSAFLFRRIDESATSLSELKAGNVDLAFRLNDRDAVTAAADPALRVLTLSIPFQAEIVFNTRSGPTADPRVRKAIRLAYDYNGGLKGLRLGNGSLANGPVPNTLACRPDLPLVKQDQAEAKTLLAEAGVPNLQLTLRFQPAFEVQAREATLLQSNLREIGVTLNLEPIAFPNWLASLKDINSLPQMMLFEDFAQFPDPGIMLVKGYKSDAIGTNRTGYSNPEVDKLLDEVMATSDYDARCKIYAKVQELIDADSVMLDMYSLKRPLVYRADKLKPFRAHPTVQTFAPSDLRLATK